MKISAISSYNYVPKSQNFKGILKYNGSSSDHWDYYGEISGSSIDGHYVGSNDDEYYIYHPFSDESEEHIKKEISANSYYSDYTSMGYGGGCTRSTERGRTIPYTEKEWNRLSKREKERIMSLL